MLHAKKLLINIIYPSGASIYFFPTADVDRGDENFNGLQVFAAAWFGV
jgi:hypothetical protein